MWRMVKQESFFNFNQTLYTLTLIHNDDKFVQFYTKESTRNNLRANEIFLR